MAKQKFKLDDDEIVTKVDAKVKNCIGMSDSAVSIEREKVQRAYNGETPKPAHNGNSKYVSSDVYDGVEQMKAQLLETFAAGHQIIKFAPKGAQDVRQAAMETTYIDHVVFEQNPGFHILHDAIDDGLKNRNAIAAVEWEEDYRYDTEDFEQLPLQDAMALVSQESISDFDADLDEDYSTPTAPVYKGSFKRKIDRCRVAIKPIAPEEWFIEAGVKTREDGVRGHKTYKTKAELYADGFDKKKVDSIEWADASLTLAPEAQARTEQTDNGAFILGGNEQQEQMRRVLLTQAYMKLALKDDNSVALYRIVYAANVLFECVEVDEDCYVDWAPLRRAHTWWGNNFANRIIPTQNARTVLTRGILDHTVSTTNPRYEVVQGALLNPREMLDNRFGGIVNTTRPDGVKPFQQANLNPFIFETLTMLKDNKQENTGISSLSQGLNKDAISNQNAEGMVDTLITVSQVRQKIVARNFAEFIKQLYLKVWRVVMKNEKKQHILEVAGDYVEVDPTQWVNERGVTVSYALGYGEQEKEAAKLTAAYDRLSKDPNMKVFVGPPEIYKLASDTFKKNGIFNYADYIKAPNPQTGQTAYPPPPPDPIEMGKVKAAQDAAQAALITAQAAAKKADVSEHHEMLRTQNDTAKTNAAVEKIDRDMHRQDLDTVNRIDVSQREIKLAEEAPPADEKVIVSANG